MTPRRTGTDGFFVSVLKKPMPCQNVIPSFRDAPRTRPGISVPTIASNVGIPVRATRAPE